MWKTFFQGLPKVTLCIIYTCFVYFLRDSNIKWTNLKHRDINVSMITFLSFVDSSIICFSFFLLLYSFVSMIICFYQRLLYERQKQWTITLIIIQMWYVWKQQKGCACLWTRYRDLINESGKRMLRLIQTWA